MPRLRHFMLMSMLIPSMGFAAPAPWSYDEEGNGQDNWGEISGYELCDTGTSQSPVSLHDMQGSYMPALGIGYRSGPVRVNADKSRLEIVPRDSQALTDGGTSYRLKKIEFHSPSEHTFGDAFYALEIEFVHEAQGKTLVLSVFAGPGKESAALKPLLAHLPAPGSHADFSFDAASLLPGPRGYYAYNGSLTKPPCTEGVEWRVMKQAIDLSKEQLKAITDIIGRNSRMTQPLYLRTIKQTIP